MDALTQVLLQKKNPNKSDLMNIQEENPISIVPLTPNKRILNK